MGLFSSDDDSLDEEVPVDEQYDGKVVGLEKSSRLWPGAGDPDQIIAELSAQGYELKGTIESQGITKYLIFQRPKRLAE